MIDGALLNKTWLASQVKKRLGNGKLHGVLINLIYLFMSRHEVHSMNTHTLQNAG